MSDTELLAYIVKGMAAPHRRLPPGSGTPLWSVVGDMAGLGSTSATLLCERLGADPHALVKAPHWIDPRAEYVASQCWECGREMESGESPCRCSEEEETAS